MHRPASPLVLKPAASVLESSQRTVDLATAGGAPVARVGDISALLRAARTSQPQSLNSVQRNRQAVAHVCKMLLLGAPPIGSASALARSAAPLPPLSRRLRQTLDLLLSG